MRNRLSCALALILGFGLWLPAQAGAGEPGDSALIALEQGAWEAWKHRDSGYFEDNIAADGVMIRGDGRLLGKAAAIEEISAGACRARAFSLSGFHVHSVGVFTKIVSYEARQETICEGVETLADLLVSSTYTLRDGEWVNVFYQETVRPPGDGS